MTRGETGVPEENLSVQSREPTNSTHIWRRIWESNAGHISARRVLSLLRDPCTPWNVIIMIITLFMFFFSLPLKNVSIFIVLLGVSASAMIQLPPPGVVVVLIDKKFSVWNRVYKRQHPIQVRVHGREHVYQHMYIRLISFENRSIDTNFIKQDIYPKSIFQRFWIFLSLGTAHQPKRYSDWIWLCEIATFYDINLRPCFVLGFSPVFSPLLCTSFNSKYQSCTVINKDRLAINHEWNDKKQQ